MKLKDLLENIENDNLVTKYPFTRFIVFGYLSLFDLVEEFELSEERLYFPQGKITSKGQKYNYLVKVMKSDLDKIIEEVDELVGRCSAIMNGQTYAIENNTPKFLKKLQRIINWVTSRVENESDLLESMKRRKTLNLTAITNFKRINTEIKDFNLLLVKLEKIFSGAIESDYENIIFNEKAPEFDLLMNTLSLRITLLQIPSEPILPLEESDSEDLGPWLLEEE